MSNYPVASARCARPLGVLVLTAIAVLSVPTGAAAQQAPAAEKAWSVTISGGASFQPDYEGSNDYEVSPLPLLMVSYKDLVFLRGPMLGANLFTWRGAREGDKLQIGPVMRYQMGRDQDDNDALQGMGDIDGGIEAGAFVSYNTGAWSVGMTAFKDVSSSHDGMTAEFSGGYRHDFNSRLRMKTKLSTTWADDDYTTAYFGVTPVQAQRSGLRRYEPESGLKDVGLAADLDYSLTDHWGITGRVGYKRLLGDAADSPLVKDEGSANQLTTGLFLKFTY